MVNRNIKYLVDSSDYKIKNMNDLTNQGFLLTFVGRKD